MDAHGDGESMGGRGKGIGDSENLVAGWDFDCDLHARGMCLVSTAGLLLTDAGRCAIEAGRVASFEDMMPASYTLSSFSLL